MPFYRPFNPSTGMRVDRIIDAQTDAPQAPTGTGEANQINIHFGTAAGFPGGSYGDDTTPVKVEADGKIIFNEPGWYMIKTDGIFGRLNSGTTAKVRLRTEVLGSQAGREIGADIPTQRLLVPTEDINHVNIPFAGFYYYNQLMRDSSGADDGGLYAPELTSATAPSWGNRYSAALRIMRYINV